MTGYSQPNRFVLAGGSIVDPEVTSGPVSLQSVITRRSVKGAVGWKARGLVKVRNKAFDFPKQARNCSSNGLFDESILTAKNDVLSNLFLDENLALSNQADSVDTASSGSISVYANENIDFIISDSQARKTGYESSTNQIVEQIPNSTYYLENITAFDDPNDNSANSIAQIQRPASGNYQLTVKGTQTGTFSVTINRSNRYGQSLTPIVFNGTIQNGETKTFTFNYSYLKNSVDFDLDGQSDVSLYRPSNGVWYLLNSTSGFTSTQFGLSTDKLVPADFDGDEKTDVAVYRNRTWYLQRSRAGFLGIAFGTATDIPMPADFSGDGQAEITVFRPSNGVWYIYNLVNNQFTSVQFGQAGDIPVAADYDGDGKTDVAVYRSGTWYVNRSQLGFLGFAFGLGTDKPVPSDYDGDGKTDISVFRPSNGTWYMQQSTKGFVAAQFGVSIDKPAPADYDGDGKADIAVFRDGTWYIQRSQLGFTGVVFGVATDKPVPNAFVP